eukprot:CAMPEP_0119376028 /NCGR_PEP_ID=MMETSP1334-20130426/38262_1 /TAXON_ID=127549 /ORGANISM="Calcidiscus leptoporus, Strain RCC1130" /LENGTH=100 /DNA_ID=CAMNT_0007394493 /DNA_START=401 /DNA_END=703 /DNA_ORIENTATION=+
MPQEVNAYPLCARGAREPMASAPRRRQRVWSDRRSCTRDVNSPLSGEPTHSAMSAVQRPVAPQRVGVHAPVRYAHTTGASALHAPGHFHVSPRWRGSNPI